MKVPLVLLSQSPASLGVSSARASSLDLNPNSTTNPAFPNPDRSDSMTSNAKGDATGDVKGDAMGGKSSLPLLSSLPSYIPLRVRSPYSLLRGMVRYNDMAGYCEAHGVPAIGVTDTGNLFGALDASMSLTGVGVQPLIGGELCVRLDESSFRRSESVRSDESSKGARIVLLAQTPQGYTNLVRLFNVVHREAAKARCDSGDFQVSQQHIFDHAEGLLCITGGHDGPLTDYIASDRQDMGRDWLQRWRHHWRDRLYLGISRQRFWWEGQVAHGAPSITSNLPLRLSEWIMALAYEESVPMVALHESFYPQPEDADSYRVLRCIGQSMKVGDPNVAPPSDRYLWSPTQMAELFADLPEALANTVAIAQRCSYVPTPSPTPLLPTSVDPVISDDQRLARDALEGLTRRLVHVDWNAIHSISGLANTTEQTYHDRLTFELGVIARMGFSAYYLIVADFVGWSHQHGIPVGPSRGSGGGSIVAWALGITAIDPIRYRLVFERFLNPERVSMPDFDIDFCVEGRDRVVDYVRHRYGEDKVAQIITFGSLGARAVIRDVGRALGVTYRVVERVCQRLVSMAGHMFELRKLRAEDFPPLRELMNEDSEIERLIEVACRLEGLYRHSSTHAGGVIIADRPLADMVPIYVEPRLQHRLVGFNMKMTEAAGLVKFDLLGLKTLTTIERTLGFVRRRAFGAPNTPDHRTLTAETVPLDDPKAFEDMCNGRTFGIFQLESVGMRETVIKLKPNRVEDIIALVALYRPGPMKNIPSYIARRHGHEEIKYPHPLLEPLLKDTLGIVIYQEQVLEIAKMLAGFSLGKADLLRRAMGKKFRAEMERMREQFINGAREHSRVEADEAGRLFDILEEFSDYGFNRAHAAGYAIVAYQTAWFKAHYPHEFMAASMSMDAGFTDRLNEHVRELRLQGLTLFPPDVNHSEPDFTPEYNANGHPIGIRYGLAGLKGVGRESMRAMVAERTRHGAFTNISQWLDRIALMEANNIDANNDASTSVPSSVSSSTLNNVAQIPPIAQIEDRDNTPASHRMEQLTPMRQGDHVDKRRERDGGEVTGNAVARLSQTTFESLIHSGSLDTLASGVSGESGEQSQPSSGFVTAAASLDRELDDHDDPINRYVVRASMQTAIPGWVSHVHRRSLEHRTHQTRMLDIFAMPSTGSLAGFASGNLVRANDSAVFKGMTIEKKTDAEEKAKSLVVLEAIQNEYKAFGFYMSRHPLSAHVEILEWAGVSTRHHAWQQGIEEGQSKERWMSALFLKRRRRTLANGKMDVLTLSDLDGSYEVRLFSDRSNNDATLRAIERMEEALADQPWVIVCGLMEARNKEGVVRIGIKSLLSLHGFFQQHCRAVVLKVSAGTQAEGFERIRAMLDRAAISLPDSSIARSASTQKVTRGAKPKLKSTPPETTVSTMLTSSGLLDGRNGSNAHDRDVKGSGEGAAFDQLHLPVYLDLGTKREGEGLEGQGYDVGIVVELNAERAHEWKASGDIEAVSITTAAPPKPSLNPRRYSGRRDASA